jgi:hypothetical protein
MDEMSREASQLVKAGRVAFHPTAADRARLIAAVTGTATLSAGVARAAGAQRSLRRIFGVTHAARLLVIALPVAAAGAHWLHVRELSPAVVQRALPTPPPPILVAPSTAQRPLPLEPQAVEPPHEPSEPERSGSTVSESSKPGNDVHQEVALLSKAQAALSRGRPQEALEAISEHARRFPHGVLAEERAATLVRTLCALGRTQAAAEELKRVEKLNPTSAYLARARESCGL